MQPVQPPLINLLSKQAGPQKLDLVLRVGFFTETGPFTRPVYPFHPNLLPADMLHEAEQPVTLVADGISDVETYVNGNRIEMDSMVAGTATHLAIEAEIPRYTAKSGVYFYGRCPVSVEFKPWETTVIQPGALQLDLGGEFQPSPTAERAKPKKRPYLRKSKDPLHVYPVVPDPDLFNHNDMITVCVPGGKPQHFKCWTDSYGRNGWAEVK